jgi:hypothetical protein
MYRYCSTGYRRLAPPNPVEITFPLEARRVQGV